MQTNKWRVLNEGLGFHPKGESLDRTPETPALEEKLDTLIQVIEHQGTPQIKSQSTTKIKLQGIPPQSTPTMPERPLPKYTQDVSTPPTTPQSTPALPQPTKPIFAPSIKKDIGFKNTTPTSSEQSQTTPTSSGPTPYASQINTTSTRTQAKLVPEKKLQTSATPTHITQAHTSQTKTTHICAEQNLSVSKAKTQSVAFSWPSIMTDALIVLSLNLLVISALIFSAQLDISNVLSNLQNNTSAQLAAVVFVLVVLKTYILLTRSFWGRTLGEWTWGLQMGRTEQIKKIWYPALILWRSLLVFATGFVVFFTLSILCRRDILYYLTGLRLYKT